LNIFSGQKGEKIIYCRGVHARGTSPSPSAFFGEGFIPHPSQQQFVLPEIGESKLAYGDDDVFSSMTTTHSTRVRGPVINLNRSYDSSSPALRRAHVFYCNSPATSGSSVGRSLLGERANGTTRDWARTVSRCSRKFPAVSKPLRRYNFSPNLVSFHCIGSSGR
jgi:hypothetical protein